MPAPFDPAYISTSWVTVVVAGGLLAVVAVLGDVLRRSGLAADHSRRVVHLLVGLLVAAAPWALSSPAPLYALALVFVAVNGIAWAWGWLPGMHEARPRSIGTWLFPLAVLPALAVTWSVDPARIPAFQVAFLVLAVADPVASWMGDPRADVSRRGSLAFALTALTATIIGLLVAGPQVPFGTVLTAGIAVAAVSTAAEALGRNGWDNLFIVLAITGILVPWLEAPASPLVMHAVFAGAVFGGIAYAAKALTADGALAGGLLAASLVGWVDATWALPAIAFFVGSSALSVLGNGAKEAAAARAEKSGARDAMQVLANGGVAWIVLGLALVSPAPAVLYGMLGAFAAAAADTWATELGTLGKTEPLSLRSWSRVPPGTSGAVSLAGTSASVLGAASVALTAWAVALVPWTGALVVVIGGISGAWADSLAGAFIQARYRNPVTGALSEERPAHTRRPVHGLAAVNNDVVNAIGTATGACLTVLLALLFGI